MIIFTQTIRCEQGVMQGQSLRRIQVILFQSFYSSKLVAIPKLKTPIYLTIYYELNVE